MGRIWALALSTPFRGLHGLFCCGVTNVGDLVSMAGTYSSWLSGPNLFRSFQILVSESWSCLPLGWWFRNTNLICLLLLSSQLPLAQTRGLTLGLCLSVSFPTWLWCAPQSRGTRDLGTPLANTGTYCSVFTWHVRLLACFKTHVTTSVKLFWPYFLSFWEVFALCFAPHCHHNLLYSIN